MKYGCLWNLKPLKLDPVFWNVNTTEKKQCTCIAQAQEKYCSQSY